MSNKNSKIENSLPNPNSKKYSRSGTALYNAIDFGLDMPKLVQGVVFLEQNRVLKINIFCKVEAGYDRVVNVTDGTKNPIVELGSDGEILIKYLNYNKKNSSTKILALHFASGHIKSITVKVPGFNSALSHSDSTVTSLLSISPYSNMLSVSGGDNQNQAIITSIHKVLDPYDVFNFNGLITSDLPFDFYINSESLNETFVEAGVSSSNKNVDNGISARGVGSLYTGPNAQEVHFTNLIGIDGSVSEIKNKSDVNSNLNSYTFTYGFLYGENLYNISDDARTFYVCMDEGQSSYYKTSLKDCDGVAIGSKYISGQQDARFVDGQCCDTRCDSFQVEVFNTSPKDAYLNDDEGKLTVRVEGGTPDYIYLIESPGGITGPLPTTTTFTTSETEYEFTGIGLKDIGDTAFKITVTDANGCSKSSYIQLNQQSFSTRGLKLGCTDTAGFNYDSSADSNSGCFYCMTNGSRGQSYQAIGFGASSTEARELGIELISPQHTETTHATATGNSDGKILFRGEVMADAVPVISNDTDEIYRLRLYSLGSGDDANEKTKSQILALSATTTVTGDLINEFTGLAKGWYAIAADVQNVPSVANCISIYRFKVGYGGCTDETAENYDQFAVYDTASCTYDCPGNTENIIVKDTRDACTKTVQVGAPTDKNFESISWLIGNKSYTGPGPHLALSEDYVTVTRENSKTGCSSSAEYYIDSTDCNINIPITARSSYFLSDIWLSQGGCTDETAVNYECDALYDNDTCIEPIYGCTSQSAVNFDFNATVDDGTCIEAVAGCCDPMHPTYNPLATICIGCNTLGDSGIYSPMGTGQIISFKINRAGPNCPSEMSNIDTSATSEAISVTLGIGVENGANFKIPPGLILRAYLIPVGGLTIEGYGTNNYSLPLGESNYPIAAEWIMTGPGAVYPNVETEEMSPVWVGDTGFAEGLQLAYDSENSIVGYDVAEGTYTETLGSSSSGSIGYGGYVFELEIPSGPGRKEYARAFINCPHNFNTPCDIVINNGNNAGLDAVAGSNIIGCTDSNAFNYRPNANLDLYLANNVGYSEYPGGQMKFDATGFDLDQGGPFNNVISLAANLSTIVSLTQAGQTNNASNLTCVYNRQGGGEWTTGMSEFYYPFAGTPCIPPNMQGTDNLVFNPTKSTWEIKKAKGKLDYIQKCLYNGLINWYTNLTTGRSEKCENNDLMMMSMIEYLLSRLGLDCIYNCADSTTPDYDLATCEEKWKINGSMEIKYDSTTGLGNQDIWENMYHKVTGTAPMLGDTIPDTIWISGRVTSDTSESGAELISTGISGQNNETFTHHPYGITQKINFYKCYDPKKLSGNVNYLDKFFKFASIYCQNCSPCSLKPGNKNKFISTNITINDIISDSTVSDSNLSVGGLSLDIGDENINY
tara:strand:- start:4547 stop:8728 length:4182 start_codon:yes stop_codon:yes gene_type:complete